MSSGSLMNDEVLQRNIMWETYLTARLISDRDLQLIRRFDKATDKVQASLMEEVCSHACIAVSIPGRCSAHLASTRNGGRGTQTPAAPSDLKPPRTATQLQ